VSKDTPAARGSWAAGVSRWMTSRDNGVPGCRTYDTERRERIMPRLDLHAVRATWRVALRRLDSLTLETLNPPAGGRRPRS
jgi:hypothetical protein